MIYLPWIAFLLGIAWMTRQGYKAKREYLRRKAEEHERTRLVGELEKARAMAREDALVEALRTHDRGQGQITGLAEAVGGGRGRGFGYGTGSGSVS
jgi:hypothetical protein